MNMSEMQEAFDRMVKDGRIELQQTNPNLDALRILQMCVETARILAVTRGWGLSVDEVLVEAARIEDFVLNGARDWPK